MMGNVLPEMSMQCGELRWKALHKDEEVAGSLESLTV